MPFNLYKNPLSEALLNNIASEYLPRQFLIAKSNELKREKNMIKSPIAIWNVYVS